MINASDHHQSLVSSFKLLSVSPSSIFTSREKNTSTNQFIHQLVHRHSPGMGSGPSSEALNMFYGFVEVGKNSNSFNNIFLRQFLSGEKDFSKQYFTFSPENCELTVMHIAAGAANKYTDKEKLLFLEDQTEEEHQMRLDMLQTLVQFLEDMDKKIEEDAVKKKIKKSSATSEQRVPLLTEFINIKAKISGKTPIHYAIKYLQPAYFKLLLDKGADLEICCNEAKNNAILEVIESTNRVAVYHWSKELRLNQRIIDARRNRALEMLRDLLSASAGKSEKIKTHRNWLNCSALFSAIRFNDDPAITAELAVNGFDVDERLGTEEEEFAQFSQVLGNGVDIKSIVDHARIGEVKTERTSRISFRDLVTIMTNTRPTTALECAVERAAIFELSDAERMKRKRGMQEEDDDDANDGVVKLRTVLSYSSKKTAGSACCGFRNAIMYAIQECSVGALKLLLESVSDPQDEIPVTVKNGVESMAGKTALDFYVAYADARSSTFASRFPQDQRDKMENYLRSREEKMKTKLIKSSE